MSDQQVKVISTKQAEHFMNPLYEAAFKRESLTYNVIFPEQASSIMSSPTTMPQLITLKIPNKGQLAVADTYLSFKVAVDLDASSVNVGIGDYVYQKNCMLYVKDVSAGTSAELQQFPLTAMGFFEEIQLQKQNMKNDGLDFKQQRKYRDNIQYTTVDQEYANTWSDYLLFNNDERILYRNTTGAAITTGDVRIWIVFNIPLAQISPIFANYAFFPFGLLNSFIQLDMTPNRYLTGFDAFADYQLKIAYYNNTLLLETLRQAGPIFGTFNDYYLQQIAATTRLSDANFKIDQEYNSLDMIQINAFASRTAQLYYCGFNSIDGDLTPAVGSENTYGLGKIQLNHSNQTMFARQFNTFSDLIRANGQYNNASTSFQEGLPDFFKPNNMLNNYNVFNLKLDDVSSADTFQAATYSGLHTTAGSNTIIEWALMNYNANLQNAVQSTASTAISYDIMFYFSNMFKIADGDLVVYGKAYEALGKALELK